MPADRRLALARAIIRLAALLTPAGLRHEWRHEWTAELASLGDLPFQYRRPVRRALGAFSDAFWLRQRSVADFDWVDDVRHGVRQLVQHSGFAVTVIGIASLGLAATVTMFSVTDQILLRPLPYPDADRIVTIWETRLPSDEPLDVAPANFIDWHERARSFEYLAGIDPWAIDIQAKPRPEVWSATKVTEGFFEAFGVTPLAGRLFTHEEYTTGRDNVLAYYDAPGARRSETGGAGRERRACSERACPSPHGTHLEDRL